jgi:hypothetical protein
MEDGMIFIFIGLIWVVGFVVFGINYFRGERSVDRARNKGRPSAEPRFGINSRGSEN